MESIRHILEILSALAIWSTFLFFIYIKREKSDQKARELRRTRFIIKVNTNPIRYWSAENDKIKDAKDLRYWSSEIKNSRQWTNYSELADYMARNNIPGEVMQYPTK